MEYCDLSAALKGYREGRNVTELLRQQLGETANTPQIIEIAYDLQAGHYVELARANPGQWRAYTTEIAGILHPHARDARTILEAGTGEMTSLAGVANLAYPADGRFFACDLSWSRLKAGQPFVRSVLDPGKQLKLEPFVADFAKLPLLDKSIDLVWTSHALEPNGGRELDLLRELFRVARRRVVLFEPSYEDNSAEGQARMTRLGYVRGLPDAIASLGGRLHDKARVTSVSNPLNPTYAYVIEPPEAGAGDHREPAGVWACPTTRLPLERRDGYCFSPLSKLAYPILEGIPVLRTQAAMLATIME